LLGESLAARPEVREVVFGVERFREGPPGFDVVHLHWPEALVRWREPGEDDIARLRRRLEDWRRAAVLVATVHNRFPHYRDTEAYRRLFRTVYEQMDGVVHMGKASRNDFANRYPHLASLPQEVIPHGLYSSYANEVTPEEARADLGISRSTFVVLSFGSLRHPEELRLLVRGFRALPLEDKRLLIAGTIEWHRLRAVRLYQRWQRWRLSRHADMEHHPGFIPDERVQHYLNAADVLVVPRHVVLNSGSLVLGFTFGRAVAGPDTGVVGEILRETGNPVFEPWHHRSLTGALLRARDLGPRELGARNRAHAEAHWGWEGIAERYVRFYRNLAERKVSG
jgi:glycosyltransferase involved in cell wall biosynthesis